jgi:4-hydroxybenzoyl-CoA thioesterase
MIYRRQNQIEFNHCDPAGIVFYPRYFEMVNSVVENFFAEVAGHPFAAMMAAGQGVPTAQLETRFLAPSRLGERLEWSLQVVRVGGASLALALEARGGAELRLTCALTVVFVTGGRPTPWPAEVRARLDRFKEAS